MTKRKKAISKEIKSEEYQSTLNEIVNLIKETQRSILNQLNGDLDLTQKVFNDFFDVEIEEESAYVKRKKQNKAKGSKSKNIKQEIDSNIIL